MVTLTFKFPDENALLGWFAAARHAGVIPDAVGVRAADALDLPHGRTWLGCHVVTAEPGITDWSLPPAGEASVAADLGLADDRCRHCGMPHDQVPDDLCDTARAEYDDAGSLAKELGIAGE